MVPLRLFYLMQLNNVIGYSKSMVILTQYVSLPIVLYHLALFSPAFSRVSHSHLLFKLRSVGVGATVDVPVHL